MEEYLAYLLELRLKVRGSAEATALVDRCLVLIAEAQEAEANLERLEREVAAIGDELALMFGAPADAVLQ